MNLERKEKGGYMGQKGGLAYTYVRQVLGERKKEWPITYTDRPTHIRPDAVMVFGASKLKMSCIHLGNISVYLDKSADFGTST